MRKLAALAVLLLGALAVLGAGRGGTYQGGSYGGAGVTYTSGGGGAVDTFRVISRVTAFPNSMAKAGDKVYQDSLLATVNSSNTGGAVRYGYISISGAAGDTNTLVGLPGNIQFKMFSKGTTTATAASGYVEDDFNWYSSQKLAFIWVSANGLHNGDKIESAFLMFNAPLDGTSTTTFSTYITARLDTISADYRCVDGVSVGREAGYTDPNWLDMSWSYCDIGNNERWIPALNTRHDWHDFGPRADQMHPSGYGEYGPANYADGSMFKLDVTDAVQQASDNGTLGRGLLFVVAGYGGTSPTGLDDIAIAAGNHYAVGTAGKGCPVFTAKASSRRGEQVWGGARVPIVLTFDDNKSDHTLYMPVVRGAGLRFTVANQVDAYFTNFARYDSLMTANAGYVDIIHHSKTHVSTGSFTGATLNAELEKDGYYNPTVWHAGVDTSQIAAFAYPGDATRPRMSLEALSKMISYGYTAARAIAPEASTSSIGVVGYPAWLRPANMMAMAYFLPDSLMVQPGSSPPTALTTTAAVKEALYDAIDILYNQDRSPAILYIHNRAIDGVTTTVMQYLINEVNASNCARMMNFYDMVEMRMSGVSFVDPATITNAHADANFYNRIYAQATYSPTNYTGAAKYDSVRTAVGTPQVMKDNMLKVWVSGKSN